MTKSKDGDVFVQTKSYKNIFGVTIHLNVVGVHSDKAGQVRDLRDKRATAYFDPKLPIHLVCRKGLDKW